MIGRPGAGTRAFGWSVARTSAVNVAATAAAGLAGVVIARSLGPAVRGEYAAILAWFGTVLVVGQLGQTAATTYFVARDRTRAADYLATSRNLMVGSGVVTLGVGVFAAPLLSAGSGAATAGYYLMFATCLVSFVGSTYMFGLQATDIPHWNLARLFQPAVYLTLIVAIQSTGRLSLFSSLGLLSLTIAGQTAFGYWLAAGVGLTGGRADRALATPLIRYGLGQLASTVPTLIAARLDMLVLSLTVASADLGQYAVAVSLTSLAVPVVSAVGNIAFPRIASRTLSRPGSARLQRWAIPISAAIGVVLLTPVIAASPWLVPLVFGEGFDDVVRLALLLAPAGVLLACGTVAADLLKGHGRPMAVAKAQTVAAVATAVLLVALVPPLGTAGAAIASSVAAGIALILLLKALRSASDTDAGPFRTASGGRSDARPPVNAITKEAP